MFKILKAIQLSRQLKNKDWKLRRAAAHGLRDLQITEPSLETVFIELTGRDLRE